MTLERMVLAAVASAVTGARRVSSGQGVARVASGLVLATTLLLGPTARPLAAWLGLPMSTASCACPPTSCRCSHGEAAGHANSAEAEHGSDCASRPSCPMRAGSAAGKMAAGAPAARAAADHAPQGGAQHALHASTHGAHGAHSHPVHLAAAQGPNGAASPAAHHAMTHGPQHAGSDSSHSAHRSQGATPPRSHLAAVSQGSHGVAHSSHPAGGHPPHGAAVDRPAFAAPADPAPPVHAHDTPADSPAGRCSISSHCGGDDAASALGAQAWLRADLGPGTGWAAPAGAGELSPPAAAARLLDPGRAPVSPPPRRIAPIA